MFENMKKKWDLLYPDKKDAFKASNGWVYEYKKKWKLSSLKNKYSRVSTKYNENQLTLFIKTVTEKYNTVEKKYIFNMDETFWRIINDNLEVIGITGSENRKVTYTISEKLGSPDHHIYNQL